jgi:hypothetical protein
MSARQPVPARELPGQLPFEWLDEGRIDPSDETFRVRRRYRPDLLASVRERGIRTPLIVQPLPPHGGGKGEADRGHQGGPSARCRIVSGWGRWTGRPPGAKVPCFLLAHDLAPEGAWDAFLGDNETWNVAEIGRILARLEAVDGLDDERIIREKLPLLGLHPSRDLYRRYRRLAELGSTASALVEEESLPLRRATVLLRLPPEATDTLVSAARDLRLTLSELGEAVEWLEEVATRDRLDPAEILSRVSAVAARPGKEAFLARLRRCATPSSPASATGSMA